MVCRKKHRYLLNQLSLIKKMLLLFLGCVVMPMGILCTRYYIQTEKAITDSMELKLKTSLNNRAKELDGYLSKLISLARTFSIDENIYQEFDTYYRNDLEYIDAYQNSIRGIFETARPYYEQVRRCSIYTDNPTVINGGCVYKVASSNLADQKSFEQYLENLITGGKMYRSENSKQPFYFVFTHQIHEGTSSDENSIGLFYHLNCYKQYSTYKKWVRIDMNLSQISSQLDDPSLFDHFLLTDTEGNVIITSKDLSQYNKFSKDMTQDGILVMEKKLDNLPFILYGMYDVNTIVTEIKSAMFRNVPMFFCCISIAVIVVFSIMGNITRRINQLVDQSRSIANGDFSPKCNLENGKDEISHLEESMNQMSLQLKNLIENEYQAEVIRSNLERETTQAKLLALQSQVNPHFMFNALESIRLKAMTKGEIETAKMLKYMARMFRQLINWDESIICLKDEIKFMDEFLHIQEYRFEDEFSYDIQVEKSTERCMIPKMMVQQLVENACIHGVEAITNDRFVAVHTRIEQEQLVITVTDNGGGMTKEKLESLLVSIQNTEQHTKGVGLSNIYHRLKLYYKDQFDFQLHSVLGKGTECEIRIPVIYKDEGE